MEFSTHIHVSGGNAKTDAIEALDAIKNHEVIRMTPKCSPANIREYYDSFVETIGTPIDAAEDYLDGGKPTGERWIEIKYDASIPDEAAFRYSKNAQPFHTDESYVSTPAEIMIFYCVNAAPVGGETIFVSGKNLIADLEKRHPAMLDELKNKNVIYEKAGDMRDRPIVMISDDGSVDLNYNYYCALKSQSEEVLSLNQRFHDYLQNDLPSDIIFSVDLRPGESVAWRDSYVLHGRKKFDAVKTADRFIWKTGVILSDSDVG